MSTVDVIVPCYRYGCFLRQCVESVLAQSGPAVRVLILDDASPDHTAEVAAELAAHDLRVTLSRHASNRGHIATYNEGLDWASADYVLLLSADDYLLPGALDRAVNLMERHPAVGFVFGDALVLSEDGGTSMVSALPGQDGERTLDGAEFITISGPRNIVPTPTAVIRTELQKKVGVYRAELPHSADMEMWLRLSAHAPVGYVAAAQAVYRRHANNMSLAYMANSWLPDLEQRRDALNHFFDSSGHLVRDAKRLHATLLHLLSLDAVRRASGAFNEGELEISLQISDFAFHTSPRVARSWLWAKLACKRGMGWKRWCSLQSTAAGIERRIHLPFRG